MSEYTPTRGEVLTALVIYRAIQAEEGVPTLEEMMTSDEARTYLGEAERGLRAIEREAAARALEEAAGEIETEACETPVFSESKRRYQDGLRRAAEIARKEIN